LVVSLPAQTGTGSAGAASGDSYFLTLVKEAKTRITEIDAAKLSALQKELPSLVVVDVREDNEWEKARIPGAIHVGRGVLESTIESKIPRKATPVVVYCRSGNRSAVAADVLGKMGYAQAYSLAGGITAFEAAGLPVDKTSPPK
jgi:rhodanese-related sulfurtransferase